MSSQHGCQRHKDILRFQWAWKGDDFGSNPAETNLSLLKSQALNSWTEQELSDLAQKLPCLAFLHNICTMQTKGRCLLRCRPWRAVTRNGITPQRNHNPLSKSQKSFEATREINQHEHEKPYPVPYNNNYDTSKILRRSAQPNKVSSWHWFVLPPKG